MYILIPEKSGQVIEVVNAKGGQVEADPSSSQEMDKSYGPRGTGSLIRWTRVTSLSRGARQYLRNTESVITRYNVTLKHVLCTISGMLCVVTSTVKSGRSGASYTTSTPATPASWPLRARWYTPFRSVTSQCSNGVATWIVKKLPPAPAVWMTVSLMASREAFRGAMGEAMTAAPARASSAVTNPSRCSSFEWSSGDAVNARNIE